MGTASSSETRVNSSSDSGPTSTTSACPIKSSTNSAGQVESATKSACPIESTSSGDSKCPVRQYKNPVVYNVYSQKIDPTNQMPVTANQLPAKDQTVPLPVHRVTSSIPKGGTDNETWLYPSPQMFWNALVRKNKTEGVSEKDVETVIAIHNNMNETTWNQVLQWEKLHDVKESGREPKLLRFIGRPDELSPKARLKMLCGHPEPFDRHDWVVDRGGEEVRYIIDYYHDESAVALDQRPKHLQDMTSMQSIKVDVRPALDSVTSVIDRVISMPLQRVRGDTSYNPPSFFPPKAMVTAEDTKLQRISANWKTIETNCVSLKAAMDQCQSESECSAASVALQRCTASVVCPSVVQAFDSCVGAKPNDLQKTGAAYSDMLKCLELFEIDSRKAMGTKPN